METDLKCTRCGKTYPANTEYFYKQSNTKRGFNCYCIPCCRVTGREQRQRKLQQKKDVTNYSELVMDIHREKKAITGYRQCTKCKVWKPFTEKYFHRKTTGNSTGLRPDCIVCRTAMRNGFGRKRGAKQDTRKQAGYIYVIESNGAYKIGRTLDPQYRLNVQIVPKSPYPVTTIRVIQTLNMEWLERTLHDRFADKRLNGEWFKLTKSDVKYLQSL